MTSTIEHKRYHRVEKAKHDKDQTVFCFAVPKLAGPPHQLQAPFPLGEEAEG